ncbi:MAG TPA: cytochrome B6 [Nitrospiria bacterium]|nr:cytochrome B6 [Nitrospiria bacterium]
MAEKEQTTDFEIFPKDRKKTYGLMELVKGTTSHIEKEPEDTAFCWPNLVYIELISLMIVTIGLLVLSLYSHAPLEELAGSDTTPNPMKAPWYFLGLQELLVFFDPWLAGVVLPTFIIIGLVVIPFIDFNPKGSGYYSFSERKFAVTTFAFGLALWWILIVVGVWLRGLDWQWYWPWDDWKEHKSVSAVTLIDLELLLQNMLGIGEQVSRIATYLIFAGYYAIGFTIPFILFREFYKRLGFVRYNLVMFLFLSMMGVPLKIFLRLIMNIKYVMVTPWFKI